MLPEEALTHLKVREGDNLYLTVAPDGSLRITPHDPVLEEQMRLGRQGMEQYRNALRELSK